jgi:predicted alpha/beta hydrolase family esterase
MGLAMTKATRRSVLFIQGGGEGTHADWDHQLVASLRERLGESYEVRYPRMPREDDPSVARWQPAIERELRALPDGSVVVGHSLGATILLHALTDPSLGRTLGGIMLIAAPFVGKGGWESEDLVFPPHLGEYLPPGVPVHFYHGDEDDTAPPLHLELYAHAIAQATIHRLPGRDHQLNDDLSEVAATISKLDVGREPVAR